MSSPRTESAAPVKHRARRSYRSARRASLAAEAQAIAATDPVVARVYHELAERLGLLAARTRTVARWSRAR